MQYLEQTRDGVVAAVKGLSSEQMKFKPAPDRWSVAETLEHIALAENDAHNLFAQAMKSPAGPPDPNFAKVDFADAPVPRPTLLKTFNAMMAREFRVLRRNAIATFTRAVMQPLLFVFVFAYVFPKIGGG